MNFASQSPLRVGRECVLRTLGRELVVEVFGVARDTIWVSFPASEMLREGTGVDLEFNEDDMLYCYHARVAVCPKDTSKGLMLVRAESAAHLQRRRDWRVPADFAIWLREPGTNDKLKGRMLNLTQDGALMVTRTNFGTGDVIEMIFQLPEFTANKLLAQIVYTDKTHADGVFRFGIRFIEVKRKARDAITWFLYDRIQDLYWDEIQELYPRPPSRPAAPELAKQS